MHLRSPIAPLISMIISLFCIPALQAQVSDTIPLSDTSRVWRVLTKDGNLYYGHVYLPDSLHLDVHRKKFGTIRLPAEQVTKMTMMEGAKGEPSVRRNASQRAIGLNTAMPMRKGEFNYYNYYLLYSELEYAITNRFSIAGGTLITPGNESINLAYRLRYAIPLNERMHYSASFSSLQVLYYDFFYDDNEGGGILLNSLSYGTSAKHYTFGVGIVTERLKPQSPMMHLAMYRSAHESSVVGLTAEVNLIANADDYSDRKLNLFSALGAQFNFRRGGFQIFIVPTFVEDEVFVIPGASFRFGIR